MQFQHNGKTIKLHGVINDPTKCNLISAHKLKGLLKHGAVSHCVQLLNAESDNVQERTSSVEDIPQQVSELIHQYHHLFVEPVGLPPKRVADHKIPLVPGAQPVKVRPYRYSPIQKNEIERQLQ